MKKKTIKKVVLLIFILVLSFFSFSYLNFKYEKENLEYIENSNLNDYYIHYTIIIDGNKVEKNEFLEFIKTKDEKLYEIVKNRKFNLPGDNDSFFYGIKNSDNRLRKEDFNFQTYFSGNFKIEFNNKNLFFEKYKLDYLYTLDKKDYFVKYKKFEKKIIYEEYQKVKNCERLLPKINPNLKIESLIKVYKEKTIFITNEFQISEKTKEVLSRILTNYFKDQKIKKDFFIINLEIKNIEDMICIDNLKLE